MRSRLLCGPLHWWRFVKTPDVRGFERAHALLLKIVDEAVDARQRGERPASEAASLNGEAFQDLVSLMVGNRGQRFSREEIRHQALTFLFAGHDTTTNLIAWCLDLLARHPASLAEVQSEVRAQPEGPHVFLRCCLLETLRLYPSVPVRSRTLAADDAFEVAVQGRCPMLRTRQGVVRLAKGMGVAFPINAVHRHPDHWASPDAFEPGRFKEHIKDAGDMFSTAWVSSGTSAEVQPLIYLPFGAGPRRCIGERFGLMEAEEVCAAVLRICELRAPASPPPVDEMHLTMYARGGVPLFLEEKAMQIGAAG